MTSRRGIVRIDGRRCGLLEEGDGEVCFRYDEAWIQSKDATPVSLTLPLRREPYVTKSLHPFFENLLPEGWLLEIAVSKLKLSKNDPFGLILALGADCIGAVEVVPEGSAP